MNLETLTCNSCGAPLEVPESANFVTCNHCSTRLAIRRTDSTSFTEELEQLSGQTEELAEQVRVLTRQNQVTELDRNWDRQKERYMVTNKHGVKRLPTETGALFGGIVGGVIGIVAVGFGASGGGAGPVVVGLAMIVFALFAGFSGYAKARNYRSAQRRYRRRRTELASGLADSGTSSQEYLRTLSDVPTPDEYLRDLEIE
ncbi:MAG: hypothetical protein CMJ48_08680 [Planctomycetaceae bacterium]|nr:hypothetical protein [Planctomycetaceae bacterium]